MMGPDGLSFAPSASGPPDWWAIDSFLLRERYLTPQQIDHMTVPEIILAIEADNPRSNSASRVLTGTVDEANYWAWRRSLSPLETLKLAERGEL